MSRSMGPPPLVIPESIADRVYMAKNKIGITIFNDPVPSRRLEEAVRILQTVLDDLLKSGEGR